VHWDWRFRCRIIAVESDGRSSSTPASCAGSARSGRRLTVIVVDNGIFENIGEPAPHASFNTDLAKMAEQQGVSIAAAFEGEDNRWTTPKPWSP
jgi:hypothetical protein